MRSIEFHTYLLPSAAGDGTYQLSSRKLTHWQAIAFPGATRIESSREVRQCPESAEDRAALGFNGSAMPQPSKPLAVTARRPERAGPRP